MKITFNNLGSQYQELKKEIDQAVKTTFSETDFIQGREVKKFEKEFARYLGTKYCISLNSGTDALVLGTRVLNLSPNDEIIIPVNTFFASALTATENGLKPVFVDIDPYDMGINLVDLKNKITSRTKAVVIVHLFGQPDKINEIKKIVHKANNKILIIEDACQAHGALYNGYRVGSFGDFAAFSFYPTKNLGAYGDGGGVVTNNFSFANRLMKIREYGQTKKYFHEFSGVNSRLDTLQAAILRIKLKHLDRWNQLRQIAAKKYIKLLKTVSPLIVTPIEEKYRESIYHLFVVRVTKRDNLIRFLKRKSIVSLIHYPIPLHMQKAFAFLGYKIGDFPYAEKAASEIISLPIYPDITDQQIKYVVNSIKQFYE